MPSKERQLELPLSRPERLALIDGVDPKLAGINPRSWRTCRDMLKQIEFCSSGAESAVYVDTLAARMAVYETTVLRSADKLEDSGMLVIERRYGRYGRPGRSANGWRIRWDRVMACQRRDGAEPVEQLRDASHLLQDASQKLRGASHLLQDASQLSRKNRRNSHTAHDVAATDPPTPSVLGLLGSLRSPIRGEPKTGDQKNLISESGEVVDAFEIRRLADKIVDRVGPCQKFADWDLAAKAAVLRYRLGENWLWDSVEGVEVKRAALKRKGKKLRRPWGWLHKCFATWTRAHLQCDFNGLLKETIVPPGAATWRGGDAWTRREVDRAREPIA